MSAAPETLPATDATRSPPAPLFVQPLPASSAPPTSAPLFLSPLPPTLTPLVPLFVPLVPSTLESPVTVVRPPRPPRPGAHGRHEAHERPAPHLRNAPHVRPAPLMRPPHSAPAKHTVHWFRKGLRLHDNPALRDGLVNATTIRCVFIIDPWFASATNVGINKWRFLLQCLEDLDRSLKKLNSRLFVVRGQPADALPKLFREWGTTTLTFEEDPEPYGRVRDHNITSKCRECGISVIRRVSHTLYQLDKFIDRNGGKAPLTYHQFQALIASMPPPVPAEPVITAQDLDGVTTPVSDDHDERFGVPTLEELGFDTENLKSPVWIGGESEALARLNRHLERKAWVASFGRPKMTPESLLASQTGLSPYMRFGCLSTRLFYYQLTELYKKIKGERPPLSLHGQILWREFFYCAATRNPNFDRMEGNPICVQIPWQKNPDALNKWANAMTGFPWIDAVMIQLREEGWIHHLARHAVACFLTRGDLWISWEEGMKVFDELLLDADWSVNAGMWMWLSCSSFFQQFFHCYCPVRFGRKTDPNGDFIRRYIPVLKNMPSQYIHEPWMAPEAVQQAAHCIVGCDYPVPMVNHREASQINIERIKHVYALLSKFKPAGNAINPQNVQRPSVTQSSPSPTSIIRSINQSNFLCSQSPDLQTTSQKSPCKVTEAFQGPINHTHESDLKQTPFKEIVIIQQPQNSNVSIGHITETQETQSRANGSLDENYKIDHKCDNSNISIGHIAETQQKQSRVASGSLDESYKTNHKLDSLSPQIQKNYDFKNLAIHNYDGCSNAAVYQSPIPNELYEQVTQNLNKQTNSRNSFGLEKSKFTPTFREENASSTEPCAPCDTLEPYTSASLPDYTPHQKSNSIKEENGEFSHPVNVIRDRSYTEDTNNEAD